MHREGLDESESNISYGLLEEHVYVFCMHFWSYNDLEVNFTMSGRIWI